MCGGGIVLVNWSKQYSINKDVKALYHHCLLSTLEPPDTTLLRKLGCLVIDATIVECNGCVGGNGNHTAFAQKKEQT